ncbi:MAG: DUF2380 domain-containing protein [Ignavibacteria bacterium]|nr:DUF2380 domain-containing protein [Ignavibacteria bacterium]
MKNPHNLSSSISSWTFTAEIRNLSNYYSYGMQIPNGIYSKVDDYGYGYNGMEKDDELKGSGKLYSTLFREGDTENGRWWSRDPKEMKLTSFSPYVMMGGNPIRFIDLLGAEHTDWSPDMEDIIVTDDKEDDGKSGGLSPKQVGRDPSTFKEGQRVFSGPFATGLIHHNGSFYPEKEYRNIVQDLVDSYGDGDEFYDKLSAFISVNGFSKNFIQIYKELGLKTYGGNELIGDLSYKNPFVSFGLLSNDFDIAGILGLAGSFIKGGAKYLIKTESIATINSSQLLISAPANMHKHHIFPQQFRNWFAERGITNIDDFTVLLSRRGHLKGVHGKGLGNMPGNWNLEWSKFIESNPMAEPTEIFYQAEGMLQRFGLEFLKYESYK